MAPRSRHLGLRHAVRFAASAWWGATLTNAAVAATPCPDRAQELTHLENAVSSADFGRVPDLLDDVIYAMGCGSVATPREMADLWNGEGVYLALTGESVAAIDSFQAARRVLPDGWTEVYGSGMRKAWEAAPEAASTGQIDVDPRPRWWVVFVDGQPIDDLPFTAGNGLHLIQMGPSADDIRMAKVVFLRPGATAVAAHEQDEGAKPAPPPPPTAVAAQEEEEEDLPVLTSSVGVGAAVALGRAEGVSSAAQIAAPIETAFIGRAGSGWGRVGAHAALRLGSRWVYEDDQGATSTPTGMGLHAAGGAHTSQGDVGVLVGYQWPGRVPVRILYAAPLGEGPLQFEGRLGMNVGRGAEPAIEALLAYRPPLIW